jgi:hypothetical protein
MDTYTVCANAAKTPAPARKMVSRKRETWVPQAKRLLEDSDHSCDEHCSILAALFARALK